MQDVPVRVCGHRASIFRVGNERNAQDMISAERLLQVVVDLRHLEKDPPLASEAVYLVGHRIWNSQDMDSSSPGGGMRPLARYLLEIALEMGNLKAALDLAHIANNTTEQIIPNVALKDIRAAAVARTDSRAMAIYARYLLNQKAATRNPDDRKLAYDLAQALCSMSEPADPANAVRLTTTAFHKWELPWSILRDAAIQRIQYDFPSPDHPTRKEIDQVLVTALRQGLDLYNDPEACRDLSDHPSIPEYSPEWIQLKTKSAMAGHAESCYNLARYYIEYYNLYPSVANKMPTNPEARIGLDWLELSAELASDNARTMQERYLIMALLMRENGLIKEGHEVLKRGMKNIESFSTDHRARTWSVRQMEPFERNWDQPFSARVRQLLADKAAPVLTKEQRYQGQPPWQGLVKLFS